MNDNAFVALRAYDVGTSRTPLTGQPSFAQFYGDHGLHVDHLGPLHFYFLAPFVRIFGASVGMPLVSGLISGGVALISVWVVFRQLGARAGVVAGVVMALVMFVAGAGSLMNPVSSAIAGYPIFCSAVLAWGLLCGDDRLLPLATAVVSFGVQMHLSVGPTMAVLGLVCLVGVAATWWHQGAMRDPAVRRRAVRLGAISAAIAAVLWAPVMLQQLFGRYPNLSALVRYASDSSVENKGSRSAFYQVVNVLGWPPLLAETRLHGFFLLRTPDTVTWVSAAAAATVLGYAGIRWRRASQSQPSSAEAPQSNASQSVESRPGEIEVASTRAHRQMLLVVMAGVLVVAGFLNGSRVPVGLEEARLVFYHWIWPLSFFVTLALVLLAFELIGSLVARLDALEELAKARLPALAHGAIAGAVVVMAVLAVASVRMDRPSNSLLAMSSTQPRQLYDSLADQVVEHRGDLESPVLLLTRGQILIGEHHAGLALALEERGVPVLHDSNVGSFVSPDRLVDSKDVESALVLIIHRSPEWETGIDDHDLPGRRIAGYELLPQVDMDNYQHLVHQLEEAAETVQFGPELDEHLLAKYGPEGRALFEAGLESLGANPAGYLLDLKVLETLREVPLTVELDPARLERLQEDLEASRLPNGTRAERAFFMQVRLVTADELDDLFFR